MSRGRANLASSLERIDQRRQRVEQRVFEARTCISDFVSAGGARIAGFDTDAELLSRLLFGRPHLHALLGALGDEAFAPPAPRVARHAIKREPKRSARRSKEQSKEQTREQPKEPVKEPAREPAPLEVRASPSDRIAALSRVVSLVSRLEDGIARDVGVLQEQLAAIDRDGLWSECAYLSYEEFLERALGPDPRLSLLLSVDPPPKPDALARVERGALARSPHGRADRHASARGERRLPSLADPPSTPPPRGSLSEAFSDASEHAPVFAMTPPGPSPSMPPVGGQMSPSFFSTRPAAFGDEPSRNSLTGGGGEGDGPILSVPPEAMIEENPDDEPPAWLSFAEPPPEETALVVAEPPRVSREIVVTRRAVPPILAIQLFIAALAILVGAALGWSSLHQSTDEAPSEAH